MGRNPILLAGEIGRLSNYKFGESCLTTLEVQAVLRLTKVRSYSDTGVRLPTNVLIIAPAGAGKSFLAERFYKDAIGGVDIFSNDAEKNNHGPRVFRLTKSTGWERATGRANSRGEVEAPLLLYTEFLIAPELLDFLGDERQRAAMIDQLNTALEEGKITNAQVKNLEIDEEGAKAIRQKFKDLRGFEYNSLHKAFFFEVYLSFTGCTRSPDDKLEKLWRDSGYYSRHDVFWWEPGDEEYAEYLLKRKVPPNFLELLPINETIWRTEFKHIPEPPETLIEPLRTWLVSEYKRIARHTGRPMTEFGNQRDIVTLSRVMTAHAIARIFAGREPGDTSPVETVEYTQADADFTKHYFMERTGHLAMRMLNNKPDQNEGCPDWTIAVMRQYLATLHEDETDYIQNVSKSKFFEHAIKTQGKKIGAARNALTFLKKAGYITYGRGADEIHIDTGFMTYLGYRDRTLDHDPLAEEMKKQQEDPIEN